MKNSLLAAMLLCLVQAATAGHRVIDISGNNTSSDYVSYSNAISLPLSDTVEVRMARYCYFSSTITGSGTVDNYGIIEPGADSIGTLTIRNFATPTKSAYLFVRPASVLRFKIDSREHHDQIVVD